MKKRLIQFAFILVIMLVISLILQLIPMPDWLYIVVFVIVIGIAAFIGEAYERVIGREAQGNKSEANVEPKQEAELNRVFNELLDRSIAVKLDCTQATCDKDIVCYRGHIIPVNRVYILLSINEGVNEYSRIDKVYKN